MEDPAPVQPTSEQPPPKPERNWKKILLFLLIFLFLISLVGVGLYLLIPRLTEQPTSPAQNQTTDEDQPEAKILVWVVGKEIWVKELGSKAEKVLTEDKKILDWDLLGDEKIVYITAEKDEDEFYGTAIVSLNLKTKEKETLFDSSLESILSKKENNGVCNTEDPDISTLAVSADNKYIAYARSGLWLFDLSSGDSRQIIKTTNLRPVDLKFNISNCISYQDVRWVSAEKIEIDTGAWEWADRDLIDTSGKILEEYAYSTSASQTKQITYTNANQIFLSVVDFPGNEPYKDDGSKLIISTFTKKGKLDIKEVLYETKDYIRDTELVDNKLYFIEKQYIDNDTFNYKLKLFNLSTEKTTTLANLGDLVTLTNAINCLTISESDAYYVSTELVSTTPYKGLVVGKSNIHKLNLETKKISLVQTVEGPLLECFQINSY